MRSVTVNSIELPSSSATHAPEGARGTDFGEALQQAVAKVDSLQQAADAEAQKLAEGDGNLHETMLALEKADVTMRVAMKVRSKLLDAYTDVMRMTV